MDLSGNANKRVETLFRVRESHVVSSGLACVGVGEFCAFALTRKVCLREVLLRAASPLTPGGRCPVLRSQLIQTGFPYWAP